MSMSTSIEKRKSDRIMQFGPWYDHYVRPFGKCHPDFNTVLLSDDPRGVKVCIRKQYNREKIPEERPLYRFSRQLYNQSQKPIQRFNPHPRVPPNEDYNILHDYYRLGTEFNGAGLYNFNTCPSYRTFAYQQLT